jgi:DNA-binding NtrC family response regulator
MQLIAIVHQDAAIADAWAVALSGAGYRVVTSTSFEEGKALLEAEEPPALLIVSVRLGAYNGLHLVIRGYLDHPGMVAVLTSDTYDPVLAEEAATYGATYIAGPVQKDAVVALSAQALGDSAVQQS